MKKIILGISMMMLSAVGFSATAQSQQANQNDQNCQKEQCEKNKKECKKEGKKSDKKGKKGDKGARFAKAGKRHSIQGERRGSRERLFEGIELTSTQKSQIEALDIKMNEERKALRDETRIKTQEAKAEAKKEMQNARNEYNLAMKQILTADQFSKFESNRENMKANRRMDSKKDLKDRKDGRGNRSASLTASR